jgi:heat-inducible transcriptional repressor
MLPVSEQRMINHLFHQVEGKIEEWLSLAAAIISQLSQNTAVITLPKPAGCQYRHLELVSIQDLVVLVVLVLRGARIKQMVLTLDNPISQTELSAISARLNQAFEGLTGEQIRSKSLNISPLEQRITESLITIMKLEDEQVYNQSYLEGLHFLLSQPEFSRNQKIIAIMELLEHRAMLGNILPPETDVRKVQVVIGSENKAEVAQDCSLVISHYGPPNEASGIIVVVGPTRMAYPKVISSVSYLSALLSRLMGELYGVSLASQINQHSTN